MKLAEIPTRKVWKASAIGELFLDAISRIFTADASMIGTTHSHLYIMKRSRPDNTKALKNKVIRLKENGIDVGNLDLGATEIDLLDFPQAGQKNPSLSIIGAIGCGKSSLIHYVYNHLLNQVRGAEKTVPIIINCLTLKKLTPYYDLLKLLRKGWRESPAAAKKLQNECLSVYNKIEKVLSKKPEREEEAINCFSEIFSALNEFKKWGGTPILVFDNSDNIVGSPVEVIRYIARQASHNYQIVTILPVRPDTYNSYASARLGKRAFIGYRMLLQRPKLDDVLKTRFNNVTEIILKIFKKMVISRGVTIENIDLVDEKYIKAYMSYLDEKAASIDQKFLWKITNGSLRTALISIIKMANYNDRVTSFITEQDPSYRNLEDDLEPNELLIKSIMLDTVPLYGYDSQDTDNICLPNLFRVMNSKEIDVAHKYWMLCYLDVVGVPIPISDFIKSGHLIELSQDAIWALYDNGLKQEIFWLSEHDIDDETSQVYITISPRGQLFLESLIEDEDYIYQAITDIHVTQSVLNTAELGDPSWFSSRIDALSHLLSEAVKAEEMLISAAKKNKFQIILRRVREHGLLSNRLYKASLKIQRWALRAKHERVILARERLKENAEQHFISIQKLETTLEKAIVSSGKELLPLNKKINVDGGELEINLQHLGGKYSMPNGIISITGDISNSDTQFLSVFEIDGKGAELNSMGQNFIWHKSRRTCTIPIRSTCEKLELKSLRINIFADGAPYYDGLVRVFKNNLQLTQHNTYPLMRSPEVRTPQNCYFRAMYRPKKQEICYEMFFPNVNPDDGGWPIIQLDTIKVNKDEMCDLCKNCISKLNRAGMSKESFIKRKDLLGDVRASGLALAKHIMGERVMRRLYDALISHDFVGLVTNNQCLPWEACHLGPYSDGGRFPQEIGNIWRSYPVDQQGKKILWSHNEATERPLNGSVLIVGHDRWKNPIKWKINKTGLPPINQINSLEDYYDYTKGKQRVYLVGHRHSKGVEIAKNIYLGQNQVNAFELPKRSFGIFGTCHASTHHRCHTQNGGAAVTPTEKLPLGISAANNVKAVLILPLGRLQSRDVADIIGALERELENQKTESLWKIWNNCKRNLKTPMWPFFSLCGSWATTINKAEN